ncbi:MAG: hypothetical protein MJ131_05395 [Lachnospiraceae bacterium]|nr:hypothetical protein [Lachnospiraceae bacterium]
MILNANNQPAAGELLAIEGEKAEAVYLVLKGKVRVYNNSFSTVVGAGALLFVSDFASGAYSYCAITEEASVIYAFAFDNPDFLEEFLSQRREYSGPAAYVEIKFVNELERQLKALTALENRLEGFLKESYAEYLAEAKSTGCVPEPMPDISRLDENAENSDRSCEYSDFTPELLHEYDRLPYETIKNFYSSSVLITARLLKELYRVQEILTDACNERADNIQYLFNLLYGKSSDCFYKNLLVLCSDAKRNGLAAPNAMALAEGCYELGEEVKSFFAARTGRELMVETDEVRIAQLREKAAKGIDIRTNKREKSDEPADIASELASLRGSFDQIVKFARYPEAAVAELRPMLEQFIALPDRSVQDDRLKSLRKGLSEHFYQLYAMAFGASFGQKRLPKAVELFLDYGYLSERLLEKEELEQFLRITPVTFNSPCHIYTMRQWLMAICKGEKEPSRNELGQDYAEVLRELKKQGRIDDAKEKELQTNGAMKLDYEIKNVFSKVNRIVNGQLSVFVPILHSEQLIGDILDAYNSPKRINNMILELSELDYSIFYREALYVKPELGIEREIIQKEVFPDIILCPTVGSNVIMWQEITGRKRDSQARFMSSMLTYSSLRDMLIKAMGEFRWALCKTVQGANWNNIQYQSLTAEYSDYIQFFRKNKALSEEKKEKLKLQIQRGRNSLGRIFTMDYELWMKAESAGSIRLNKVAREILATYCPFKSEVRKQLQRQPLYEEAFSKNGRERVKKIHELELRYRAIEKNGAELPAELRTTMSFYREL